MARSGPLLVIFFLIVLGSFSPAYHGEGDAVIRAPAGTSEIVVTTTKRLAGAIHSLKWNGKEFIDSYDHGRQLQSAVNLDCGKKFISEVFNPTEAGSSKDGVGPTSSSKLLKQKIGDGLLETTIQMAFWLAPGEKSTGHPAYNDKILSDHLVHKRVKLGWKNLPHAISYDVMFTIPKGETHTFAQFEAVTGYMPPQFSKFWKYNSKTSELEELSDGPGEQAWPVVLATPDGQFAMGVFSPDQPSTGFTHAGYGRFRFKKERVVKWNCVFRIRNPQGVPAGEYHFRNFVLVGTLEDVRATLGKLVKEFGSP